MISREEAFPSFELIYCENDFLISIVRDSIC